MSERQSIIQKAAHRIDGIIWDLAYDLYNLHFENDVEKNFYSESSLVQGEWIDKAVDELQTVGSF